MLGALCRYDETLWRTMVISNRRVAPAAIFQAIGRNPRCLQISNCDLDDFDADERTAVVLPESVPYAALELPPSHSVGSEHALPVDVPDDQ